MSVWVAARDTGVGAGTASFGSVGSMDGSVNVAVVVDDSNKDLERFMNAVEVKSSDLRGRIQQLQN